MKAIRFRVYTSSDHESCVQIFSSNVPIFFDSIELEGFKSWLLSKDHGVKAHKTNVYESYSVVELKGLVIGCGGFYITENLTEARMAWGMINYNFHKKGIGRQFLEFRLRQIQQMNQVIPIALDTTQNTFRFFEKMGFKVTSIKKGYYTKGLDRYDMIKL
jgi:ribosomal-protein-alanine N-acetyltransferase